MIICNSLINSIVHSLQTSHLSDHKQNYVDHHGIQTDKNMISYIFMLLQELKHNLLLVFNGNLLLKYWREIYWLAFVRLCWLVLLILWLIGLGKLRRRSQLRISISWFGREIWHFLRVMLLVSSIWLWGKFSKFRIRPKRWNAN